jgi:ribose 5-phosphate isomerase B
MTRKEFSMFMKVFLATDHAGFSLKEKVKIFLQQNNYLFEDCGAFTFDKDDDYPDFISKAAEAVSKDPQNNRGIIFGGSGQGEAIVANKFHNVRCVIFYTPVVPPGAVDATGNTSTDPFEMIRLTKEHNDANMLSLGARFLTEENALQVVKQWLETPFTNDPRHARRIEKIKKIEKER